MKKIFSMLFAKSNDTKEYAKMLWRNEYRNESFEYVLCKFQGFAE